MQLTLPLNRTKAAAVRGLHAGVRTWWWLLRMMVPITLGVALLQWLGVIAALSGWLTPALSHIGLTAEGVLAFLTGSLASIYAAIGVMGTLNLDYRSVTILAVMLLVAHNLIIESVIQQKAGFASAWVAAGLRVAMALGVAWAMNRLLPADHAGTLLLEHRAAGEPTLVGTLYEWALTNAKLLPLMLGIVVGLNVLQQLLREFDLIRYLTLPMGPVMRVLGLAQQSAFLWIVLNTLGLTYGASVMINEVQAGAIPPREARLLNAHAAMNHSMLEDTLLFVALGIPVVWLLVPRMILAIGVVWAMRGGEYLKKRLNNRHL